MRIRNKHTHGTEKGAKVTDKFTYIRVFRVLSDISKGHDYHLGPPMVDMQLVHECSYNMGRRTAEDLLISLGKEWYIGKKTGIYIAVALHPELTFPFYVDPDHNVHMGWEKWRDRNFKEKLP